VERRNGSLKGSGRDLEYYFLMNWQKMEIVERWQNDIV
jgi:hypothetical protein